MDIEYLLALQGLRDMAPSFVETLMVVISFVGEGPLLALVALVVYWCADKRTGLFACMSLALGNFVAQSLKNLFAVYRPWIRDSRIDPAPAAVPGATGYSFPSGHTVGAGTVLGSFAWLLRKRRPWLCVACVLGVLLVAFSRNFLGVHTPQDVCVGLLVAIGAIAATQAFFSWIDRGDAKHPGNRRDIAATVVVLAVCASMLVVLSLKPYPLDHVDGELLVDPQAMLKGAFQGAGLFGGAMLGWLLERRLVGFSTSGIDAKTRVLRGALGVVVSLVSYLAIDVLCKLVMPYNQAKLASMFALALASVFIAPLVFTKMEKRKA